VKKKCPFLLLSLTHPIPGWAIYPEKRPIEAKKKLKNDQMSHFSNDRTGQNGALKLVFISEKNTSKPRVDIKN
jgi:hypothetical protein